jgi:hypothetical protein
MFVASVNARELTLSLMAGGRLHYLLFKDIFLKRPAFKNVENWAIPLQGSCDSLIHQLIPLKLLLKSRLFRHNNNQVMTVTKFCQNFFYSSITIAFAFIPLSITLYISTSTPPSKRSSIPPFDHLTKSDDQKRMRRLLLENLEFSTSNICMCCMD